MTITTQITTDELAARKEAIAKAQDALHAAVEVDAALHKIADRLHNEAFAKGTTPLPSFADSLTAAAKELLAQAAKNPAFPAAALARLHLYAPEITAASTVTPADPIEAAAEAVEVGSANAEGGSNSQK